MAGRVATLDRGRFRVSAEHGFLPDEEPLASFGPDAGPYRRATDRLCADLPDVLERDALAAALEDLPAPPPELVEALDYRAARRLYRLTAFLASAVVHGTGADAVPARVAGPLYAAATRLGRTPVLSYDAYVLENWSLVAADGGPAPENVRPLVAFTDLPDERWFVAVHVAIEAAAGPAVAAVGDAQQGVREDDPGRVAAALRTAADALRDVVAILDRMPEHNDPQVYDRGFRPYLTSLTDVEYEGVEALAGPQSFRGGSGAQSSLLPALDGALGVDHGDTPLVDYLRQLRADMPPAHRAFVEAAEGGPDVRAHVADAGDENVAAAYAGCIDAMVAFREHHVDVVERYLGGEHDTGTGGTQHRQFLSQFVEDTRDARL